MPRFEPPDDQLLARSRADPASFGQFYRRHAKAVMAYLAYRSRSGDDAVDLTAEVFAAAFLARSRFRPDGPPARAWLLGIARHKLADSQRQRYMEDAARRRLGVERIAMDDAALERVEQLADLEKNSVVRLLVSDLPPAERDAVLARVVAELDYVEIATRLACSPDAARKRVSRGLARLTLWARKGTQ